MKKLAGIFMLLCLTFSLTACGGKLSEEFEETEVKEAAEEIVNLINEGKLSKVYEDSFIPVLRNSVELEELQETVDYVLDKLGEFQDFEKVQVKGVKDKNTGTQYATAVVLAKYEEGNAMFTISFDTDMMCAGFFIK